MRPPTGSRLLDPGNVHARRVTEAYGVKTGREIDEDNRIALDQIGQPAGRRPRIEGSLHSGTALLSVIERLREVGIADDEWLDIDPEPRPAPYENNAGILFRGTAPSIAIGGATVVGTGGSLSLTLSDATDNTGRIVLVTGNAPAPSAAGDIGTITFVVPKSNADYQITFGARDSSAATAAGRSIYSDFSTALTTAWVLSCESTLAGNTSYHWSYAIREVESL